MDRDLSAKLWQATSDDDSKCPDDVMKDVVKLACKGTKDAALQDLTTWLQRTLDGGNYKVKMKVLRVIMMVVIDRKSSKFKAALAEHGVLPSIEALAAFAVRCAERARDCSLPVRPSALSLPTSHTCWCT